MQVIITQFLLAFPFPEVAFDDFEALRLFEVDADRDLLSADIEFDRFTLAYLLFLPGAEFDVVHLLHIL